MSDYFVCVVKSRDIKGEEAKREIAKYLEILSSCEF